MFSVHEAVARFFPAGASYDHKEAERLISWLDSCGYAVVPKAQPVSEPVRKRPRKALSHPAPAKPSVPWLRVVK